MLTKREQFESLIRKNREHKYIATYNGFTLHSLFQPLFCAGKNIMGYEALLRITSSDGVAIRPDIFFHSNALSFCDKMNVERLSRAIHLRNFAQSQQSHCRLFLNILPEASQLFVKTNQNVSLLIQRLKELNLRPEQIVMELTEVESGDDYLLQQGLERIQDMGFSIAIDDYGVKASDARRVNLIQPDILKIDKSLLQHFLSGRESSLLQALELSDKVNATTVIEGIETERQFCSMSDLDIGMYQGFHLAKPAPLFSELRVSDIPDSFRQFVRSPAC